MITRDGLLGFTVKLSQHQCRERGLALQQVMITDVILETSIRLKNFMPRDVSLVRSFILFRENHRIELKLRHTRKTNRTTNIGTHPFQVFTFTAFPGLRYFLELFTKNCHCSVIEHVMEKPSQRLKR